MQVAVVGGGDCNSQVREMAFVLGKLLAREGHILLCGGLGGVMEAACQGAREERGTTVGILPEERGSANEYIDIFIATGMGHARNAIIVKSCDAVVALPGGHGTLSEIALALKMGSPVISLQSWDIPGVIRAKTPQEAVEFLQKSILFEEEDRRKK